MLDSLRLAVEREGRDITGRPHPFDHAHTAIDLKGMIFFLGQILERSRCRADANTDQYQIRRQTLTVFQFHRFNLVCALNLRGFAVGVKHHAVGHMAGKNGFADRCAELFGEGHLVTGQHGDVQAVFA